MASKTSLYLTDDQKARWKASGVSLAEIVHRGLDAEAPQSRLARDATELAVRAAHDDMYAVVEDLLGRVVKNAMRDARAGDW